MTFVPLDVATPEGRYEHGYCLARQVHIYLGALRFFRELSLVEAVASVTRRPPTNVGLRESRFQRPRWSHLSLYIIPRIGGA